MENMFNPIKIKCLKCGANLNIKNLPKHQRKMHRGMSIDELWKEHPAQKESVQCLHTSKTGKRCLRKKLDKYYCMDHLKSHGCIYANADGSNRCGNVIFANGYCREHYDVCYLPLINKRIKQKSENITKYNALYPKTRGHKPVIVYSEYLLSPEWKERARKARKRAEYRCQLCNASDEILDVHHRTYERLGNEKDSDLIVLCRSCHTLFETYSDRRPSRRGKK